MLKNFDEIVSVILVVSLLLICLISMIIIVVIRYNKKQLQHKEEKKTLSFKYQQALLQTQIEIQEQTLKTIAQEIHDNIGQVLSLAKLNLNTLQFGEETKLIDTKNLVSKAINDLRNLSRSLHGDKITELGLQDSVENELLILQNSGQYQTHCNIIGEPYKLLPQQEMVLFRIAQEAMNNAIKHAKAKSIIIKLVYLPQNFNLSIIDDGIGFNSINLQNNQTGIGLKNMQNRAALIGGIFNIKSAIGVGTTIDIELKR